MKTNINVSPIVNDCFDSFFDDLDIEKNKIKLTTIKNFLSNGFSSHLNDLINDPTIIGTCVLSKEMLAEFNQVPWAYCKSTFIENNKDKLLNHLDDDFGIEGYKFIDIEAHLGNIKIWYEIFDKTSNFNNTIIKPKKSFIQKLFGRK